MEQLVISKPMTALSNHLESKLRLLQNEERIPEKNSEDLIRKYSDQKKVVQISL